MHLSSTILQDVSAMDVVRWSAAALFCFVAHTIIYRLYFHPLAKHPGPLFARLSILPAWWHTIRKDRHVWLLQLQEQYGTTVRYRPDIVAVNTPDGFRALMGPRGNNTKGLAYEVWPREADAPSTIGTIDNATHGRKRRVLANAFSERALRAYEPFVRDNVVRWTKLMDAKVPQGKDEWSESLNVADWMNWLVFDVMGDLCFGKSFGMKEEGSSMRSILDLMSSMLEFSYVLAHSPIAPLWIWLKPRGLSSLLDRAMPADILAWYRWLGDALAERTKSEKDSRLEQDASTPQKDFFHYIFQTVDAETGEMGYTDADLLEECQLLVTAGADTTAIVMAALLFYLVRRDDAQARLADEVLGAFDSAEQIAPGPKLQSCTYLRAVINEGLRMAPPVPAELARRVLAGGTVIEGEFFVEGTNVSVSPWAVGYNEKFFAKPFKFCPERWIVGEEGPDGEIVTEESVRAGERGLCAFSAGSRGCVGKNLAWMEMSLVLAMLFYSFEIRQDPTSNLGGGDPVNGRPGRRNADQYQLYDVFVSLRDGPLVQLKRRAHSSARRRAGGGSGELLQRERS